MTTDVSFLQSLFNELPAATRTRFAEAVSRIVTAKQRGKVVVITGSGLNIHEGVTTLIAQLMRAGLVDGVTTSSAVVSHEMGGTLDPVKRCPGESLGLPSAMLPRGGEFAMGLWLEHWAQEILTLACEHGRSFEEVAGLGADERMIGIGARRSLPVLVTMPQLVGGGAVGLHRRLPVPCPAPRCEQANGVDANPCRR